MNIFKFIFAALFTKYRKQDRKYSPEEYDRLSQAERCLNLIEKDELSIEDARWYLHILPTHYYKKGYYKEEVHDKCNACHKKLWEYCKKEGYIEDIGYEEFTERGMIHFKI